MKDVIITLKSSFHPPQGDEESFELVTDGKYVCDGDTAEFSYMESELTGFDGLKTTFNVSPYRIVLSRAGGINGDMIFIEGQRNHFVYDTPYGSATMGIDTHSVKNRLGENGGSLEISYSIFVESSVLSRNHFEISIR